MLGVFFAMGAIALLARRTDRAYLVAAGILGGLALLTKQSLFAAAIAGTVWLLTMNARKAGVFALATALTALVPGLALQWTSGGAFWDNIGPANPSPTAFAFGAYLFKEWVALQGIPTLLALIYVIRVRAWRPPVHRLVLFYWLATSVSLLGIIKVGANHNYWIELAAASAVLATLAVWTCLGPRRRWIFAIASMLPVWLLALQLAVLTPARFVTERNVEVLPLSWTLFVQQFRDLIGHAPTFNLFLAEMRREQGIVLAETLDIAVLSDRPLYFEPFAFSMLEYEGRWDSRPLVDDICAGRISLLILSYPISVDIHPVGLREFPMFPPSVMAALRHAMRYEGMRHDHWVYRPPESPTAVSIAACETAAAAARGR